MSTTDEKQRVVIKRVEDFLGEIQYGSIEIILHAGRVTQIEKRERTRFEKNTI